MLTPHGQHHRVSNFSDVELKPSHNHRVKGPGRIGLRTRISNANSEP